MCKYLMFEQGENKPFSFPCEENRELSKGIPVGKAHKAVSTISRRMTRVLSVLLSLLCSAHSWAYNFEEDSIYYNILSYSERTCEVTYYAPTPYYNKDGYTGTVIIPSTVKHDNTTYIVTSIGDYAFRNCMSLTSVTIPNSVVSIGDYAFYYCSGLTGKLVIPNSVPAIREYTFAYCSGLTSVTIGEGVTEIGSCAFYGCSELTQFEVAEVNEYYCSVDGVLFTKEMTTLIQFPASSSITSYKIPNSVMEIGDYAFYQCTGLTQVTIPESVNSIGASFSGCKGLLGIYVNNSTPPTITGNTFSGVDKDACTVYVPVGSSGVYRLDNYWGEFYNITPFDFTGVDDVSNNGMIIKSEAGAILVKGENVPVSIYDTGGMLLYHKDDCKNERIVLPSGKIYIVKVGEQVRKVRVK